MTAQHEGSQVSRQMSVDRASRRGGGALPKFYTVEQVALLLEVSTMSVRRWIDAGRLVAHRFGGSVRIAEPDLRAFLAQHRTG